MSEEHCIMGKVQEISFEALSSCFHLHVDEYDPQAAPGYSRGSVIGILKKACKTDSRYRQVLKALTGFTSSKLLADNQWFALYKFVLPTKPEGGHWQSGHGNDILEKWCNTIVNHSDAIPEQIKMEI